MSRAVRKSRKIHEANQREERKCEYYRPAIEEQATISIICDEINALTLHNIMCKAGAIHLVIPIDRYITSGSTLSTS